MSVEDTYFSSNYTINVKNKIFDLSKPVVMTIVNLTSDSFYANSRYSDDKKVLEFIEKSLKDGTSILDIGANSTRPSAIPSDEIAEIQKIEHFTKMIMRHFPECILSIDTFRSEVAKIALNEGASIINDVSGLSEDEKMIKILKEFSAPYVLTHINGPLETMQQFTNYENLMGEMCLFFSEKIEKLNAQIVYDIIIDPGFGFSKNIDQNYTILKNLNYLNQFRKPILSGLSRKSMWHKFLDTTVEKSLNATSLGNLISLQNGAKILRVHDTIEAIEAIKIFEKLNEA